MQIGQWTFSHPVFVAPMAGVTDRPYRQLCKRLGASYAVTEMAASNPRLWDSVKTSRRLNHDGEIEPIAVQITGADPAMMAQAALFNIDKGAKIIDINMGCPVKKVCNVAAGSALLQNEALVAEILQAVVKVCQPHNVPVTLKTRTGWDHQSRNALQIAQMAQDCGIAALALHGRTRADRFQGEAEYDTIRAVKKAVSIPVIANGDIDSPEKAHFVLKYTQADAIMIGRAAKGRPWIFREIAHYLATNTQLAPPTFGELRNCLLHHLDDHYHFYGEYTGVRSARKHIAWYLAEIPDSASVIQKINQADNITEQLQALKQWFQRHPDSQTIYPAGGPIAA